MKLSQQWSNKTGRGIFTAEIDTTIPIKVLRTARWVRHTLPNSRLRFDVSGEDWARQLLQISIRTIGFMQITGSKPIERHSRLRFLSKDSPQIDHAKDWITQCGVRLWSTEPYDHEGHGVEGPGWVALPLGHGWWNPPATRLFLLAAPKDQGVLNRLRDALLDNGLPYMNAFWQNDVVKNPGSS
ncbi:MAG: hypothetical protein H7839_12540 [Magnetococcus sp. YQC-5]